MNNNKLTNKNTLLWVSGFSIAINLFKAVMVFQAVSFKGGDSILSFVYSTIAMIIIEFSIIIFLANGKTKDSIGFAILSVAINLYYFNGLQFGDVRLNIIEVIFAFGLPYISARMAHVYMTRAKEENRNQSETNRIESETIGKLEEQNRIQTEQIKRLSEINGKQTEELNEKEKEVQLVHETLEEVFSQSESQRKETRKLTEELRTKSEQEKKNSEKYKSISVDAQKWKESTTCKYCGHSVKSPQGLNVHQSKCAMNPKNMKVEQLEINSVNKTE